MNNKSKQLACILCIALLLTACTSDVSQEDYQKTEDIQARQIDTAQTPLTQGQSYSISDVVKSVEKSVVGISVMYEDTTDASGSLGSGVVIHSDGYILTNHHVIGQVGTIQVVFFDGTKLDSTLLWSDQNLDLAVLKVDSEVVPMPMGTSEDMDVGDTVIAIGTPLTMKFQHTVTAGIISAKNRTLTIPSGDGVAFMEDLLQTDASINPGNSGGPLINMSGQVIGINTLKVAEAEGLGFAIPIDICIPIVENVISDPNYRTPYLGIMAMDSQIAAYLGKELDRGVMVMAIDDTSPAYWAGLREGSIILSINNTPVDSVFGLRKIIYTVGAGTTVNITYQMNEQVYSTTCNLDSRQ